MLYRDGTVPPPPPPGPGFRARDGGNNARGRGRVARSSSRTGTKKKGTLPEKVVGTSCRRRNIYPQPGRVLLLAQLDLQVVAAAVVVVGACGTVAVSSRIVGHSTTASSRIVRHAADAAFVFVPTRPDDGDKYVHLPIAPKNRLRFFF